MIQQLILSKRWLKSERKPRLWSHWQALNLWLKVTIILELQTWFSGMAQSHQSKNRLPLKEAGLQMIWPLYYQRKEGFVGIQTQVASYVANLSCIQWNIAQTISQTGIPHTTKTSCTATRISGRRRRIPCGRNQKEQEALQQSCLLGTLEWDWIRRRHLGTPVQLEACLRISGGIPSKESLSTKIKESQQYQVLQQIQWTQHVQPNWHLEPISLGFQCTIKPKHEGSTVPLFQHPCCH